MLAHSQSNIDYLQTLPVDIIIEILKTEKLNDILHVCMSSKSLHTNICDNDDFWKRKSEYDNKHCSDKSLSSKPSSISWKEYYKNAYNVFSFGDNEDGQLGTKDNQNRNSPTSLHRKAKFIACGYYHTMLIDLNDDVWANSS